METVALATLCIGLVFGLRFKVFILVPAVMGLVIALTAWSLAQGAPLGSIAILNVVGATFLQIGYLGGSVVASLSRPGVPNGTKQAQAARPLRAR